MIYFKQVLFLVLLISTSNSFCQETITVIDTLGADSLVQVYHKNGQLFFQVTYKNGLQNGWYEQYHNNGNPSNKQYRINGKSVDGNYVFLEDDGSVYQKGYIKNGFQIGKWYTYTQEGECFKIYYFNNKGEIIKLKIWDDERHKFVKSNQY